MVNAHSKLFSFHQKKLWFAFLTSDQDWKEETLSHIAPQRGSSQTAQAQAVKAQSKDFKVAPHVKPKHQLNGFCLDRFEKIQTHPKDAVRLPPLTLIHSVGCSPSESYPGFNKIGIYTS